MKNYAIMDGVIYADGVAQGNHTQAVRELIKDYEEACSGSGSGDYAHRKRMDIWHETYILRSKDSNRAAYANEAVDSFDRKFGAS